MAKITVPQSLSEDGPESSHYLLDQDDDSIKVAYAWQLATT